MVTSSCEATPDYLETVPHFLSPLLGRHREISVSSGDQFAEIAVSQAGQGVHTNSIS